MILVFSIMVRLLAMVWSIVLARRIADRRMLFLTAMLALMTLRQCLALYDGLAAHGLERLTGILDHNELPGLAVSVLAAFAVLALARIIRERREVGRTLDDTVIHAQRMEAVGQFAGGVAHDFNNMLTAIAINAQLARSKAKDAALITSLDAINDATDRAAHLTKQLLAFARRDPVQLEHVDANALVRDLLPSLRQLLGAQIELTTRTTDEPATIHADKRQMEHVLFNLALNARDAMEGSGKLSIAVLANDTTVIFEVSDSGGGIEPAIVGHIFEPFFTTKPVGKGTGLGLATCHAVVSRAGGTIAVESKPGHGSTFRITLPRSSAQPAARVEPVVASQLARRGEHILVVEDEALLRGVIGSVLSEEGYVVFEVSDGSEALAELERHGDIDLVLTDFVMPNMSGRELVARLRSRPALKLLVMTGYAQGTGANSVDAPMIAKPFTPEQLVERVRQVLDTPASSSSNEVASASP